MVEHGGGMEFPTLVATIALGLTVSGPGAYSLDRVIGLSWAGTWWALGVCIAAAVTAAVTAAMLRSGRRGPSVDRNDPIVVQGEREFRP